MGKSYDIPHTDTHPIRMSDDSIYEKCADCHLLVDPNNAHIPGTYIALYVHLHRGDDADDALDASHEPRPSGMKANLATWKAYGPQAMRERFIS